MTEASPASMVAGTVWVRRDEHGQIISISRVAAADHVEACVTDDPAMKAFLRMLEPARSKLEASDLSLIRALEDLIDVLIRKEVLTLTDLPDRVQEKLISRRRLRGSLRSLSLLGEKDDAI